MLTESGLASYGTQNEWRAYFKSTFSILVSDWPEKSITIYDHVQDKTTIAKALH